MMKNQGLKTQNSIQALRDKTCSFQSAVFNSQRAGFTMVELLVAIVITALVLSMSYATFIVQQRSFTVQDQVAEIQLSSRIAFGILVDNIRTAGFGYPGDENPSINGYTEAITDNENDLLGTNNSDAVTLVGGFRQVATLALPAVVGQDAITITYLPGATPFDLSDNYKNITIDGLSFAVISNCAVDVNGDCQAGSPLTLDRGISKPFPANRPVFLMESKTFSLIVSDGINCSAPANTVCMQVATSTDTNTLTTNIDDLQFAYAVDTNFDGQIDDWNGSKILDPGDYLTPAPALPLNSKILAVRANVLATTRPDYQDPNLEPSSKPYYSTGIVLENNTTPDIDRLRRRIWSMEIALRNQE